MDSAEAINALRLVSGVSVLAYASVLDLRTRKVPNVHWIGLAAAGLGFILAELMLDEKPLEYLLVFVPILAILADIYWGSEEESAKARFATIGKYALAVASILLLAYLYGDAEYFQHLLAVPCMMLFVVALYMLDAIRGGADAKALISLSILFPFYPVFGSYPLLHAHSPSAEILFPFSFGILVNAAIIVALTPLAFLVRNLVNREFEFPLGLLGYRIEATEVARKHFWLMESIVDGKHITHVRPGNQENQSSDIDLLVKAGHRRVWVTPKIPFIVPILASLILTVAVGNLLLLIFPL